MLSAPLQSVAAVVLCDGEVLVVRHALRRLLELPGGRVGGLWEPGDVESDTEALARILRKETSLVLRSVVCCLGSDAADDWECWFYLCECDGGPSPGVGVTEAFFSGVEILRAGMWASDEAMAREGLARSSSGDRGDALAAGAVKRARQAARRRVLAEDRLLRANADRRATPPVRPGDDAPEADAGALVRVARMNDAPALLRLLGSLGHFRPDPLPVYPPVTLPKPEPLPAMPLPDLHDVPRPRLGRSRSSLAMMAMLALTPEPSGPREGRGASDGEARPWEGALLWLGSDLRALALKALRRLAAEPGGSASVLCAVRPGASMDRWERMKARGLEASDEAGDASSGVLATATFVELASMARGEVAVVLAPPNVGGFLAPLDAMVCEMSGSFAVFSWVVVPADDAPAVEGVAL